MRRWRLGVRAVAGGAEEADEKEEGSKGISFPPVVKIIGLSYMNLFQVYLPLTHNMLPIDISQKV